MRHQIRAAVWLGGGTGRWWADVYQVGDRHPRTRAYERAEVDAAPNTGTLSATFDTRDEALAYAHDTAASMRLSDALAVGMVSSTDMLDGLSERVAAAVGNPDPWEAP